MPAAAGIIIVPTNIVNIIFFPLNSIVASGYAQREENYLVNYNSTKSDDHRVPDVFWEIHILHNSGIVGKRKITDTKMEIVILAPVLNEDSNNQINGPAQMIAMTISNK